MPLRMENDIAKDWVVRKIGVIGPGIVGMPMAALLADAEIRQGEDCPAKVLVVQRNSETSGWKVGAINSGISPIKGIEPALDEIVQKNVRRGLLRATHDTADLHDADIVLVCVQTDKKGLEPDYGPLFSSLEALARALQQKPAENTPLIVIESTLAPSTLGTLVREYFASYGLVDGRDLLLGFSPNRVMPGRLVERVRTSDKLVSGLRAITAELIKSIYSRIVTSGALLETNSLTAEIVKTTENAYRDVRIAFSAEIARYCDQQDIDFFQLREAVNQNLQQADLASNDPNAVPFGGLLVPTVGVGGHCLPKDGILLLWRRLEHGDRSPHSLIEQARRINDGSPAWTLRLAESVAGDLKNKSVTLLGGAYRFNSEDTRNSPALALANLLLEKGAHVCIHDPYVNAKDQNLQRLNLTAYFTNDLAQALQPAEILIACTGHADFMELPQRVHESAPKLVAVVDACNLWPGSAFENGLRYAGIGRGTRPPTKDFVDFVTASFRVVEHGFARELNDTVQFLNECYGSGFNRASFQEVQKLAATCSTGCRIVEPTFTEAVEPFHGFIPTLVEFSLSRTLSAKA
jgi:UDP-N-acetyl-D-mannosaminuronic acid dehydrogenase